VGVGFIVYALTRPADQTSITQATDDLSKQADQVVANGETVVVTYTDHGFSPQALSVKVGTTLKVVNSSKSPLQFSSGSHPTHLEDPEINMSELKPGGEGTLLIKTVGTHTFHNHLNSNDTGTLTVVK
ncbi:MAG: cupredoxin domain-containing protein, partial [Candidatus Saccharibacteria bacterium]